MTVYRRRPAGASDGLAAAVAGFLAGSVVFYFTRTWLRREAIPSRPEAHEEEGEEEERPARRRRSEPGRPPRGDADAGAC